ncbi:PIN-like domain-containing protein [Microbispora sp. KK1-11]|uniref:PIN-like domain-containing protein n=1 Tax=Microbispora sp. KK1-11 TaxID=2053005 RepID=UPI00115C2A88|nr:PIN-like domain-containing protein [Microbispora sp. KK1-11]TQS30098.1 hypothetical protein FLW16_06995 [Microbispora sp. KK1-11]
MANLTTEYGAYYPPGEDLLKHVFDNGLIVLDANVLLNLYRYLPSSRDELLKVLERLNDNLWVPHQVGLEFSRRRLAAIRDHQSAFETLDARLEGSLEAAKSEINAFANRISLDGSTRTAITKLLNDAYGAVRSAIGKISPNDQESGGVGIDVDSVINRLNKLLQDRIGPSLSKDEVEKVKAEANRRAEHGIPPGYKDKGKGDPTGDYILWYQILAEAAHRKVAVLLVTDDVKEDWWRREQGRTLGPRPELYEEMKEKAGVPFLLMTTSGFLRNANKYLDARVSTQTIEAAQEAVENTHQSVSDEIESMLETMEVNSSSRGILRQASYRKSVRDLLRELPVKVEEAPGGLDVILTLANERRILVIPLYFNKVSREAPGPRLISAIDRRFSQKYSEEIAGVVVVTNIDIPEPVLTRYGLFGSIEVVKWDGNSKETVSVIETLGRIGSE